MYHHANYEIVENSKNTLVIRDLGPWNEYWTVTNDAENVVKELYANGILCNKKLLYFDSENSKDEILHRNGSFLGFASGGTNEQDAS